MSSPVSTLFSPQPPNPDTGIGPSRYQQDIPNLDGLIIKAGGIQVSGAPAPVLTRVGKGLWALVATATGADPYFMRVTLDQIVRTGQPFYNGGFGGPGISQSKAPFTPKGIGIIDVFVIAQVTVAALTSATLRIGTTVFSATAATAPVQADILAATAIAPLTAGTQPQVFTVPVPVGAQVYANLDLTETEIEFAPTLANTGVLAVYGIGAHVAFNYN
jgi:hypothetical protein